MFFVDPSDPTPPDAQIARAVRAAVAEGALRAGDPLPTVRQMAVQMRVGASAVERAYARLAADGVVETVRGLGLVVRASAAGADAREMEMRALEDAFLQGAAALGYSLDDVIIHLDSRRHR